MRGVYAIRHPYSEMVYVGSSGNIGQRWAYHRSALKLGRHENKPLQALYDQWGISHFQFVVLQVIDSGDMLSIEQGYIDQYRSLGRLLNLYTTAGSPAGYKHTEETRQRKQEIAKNRPPVSDETRRKISLAKMGNPGRPSFGKERRSLNTEQASRIKHLLSHGKSVAQVAKETNAARHTVGRIARGELYVDVAAHLNLDILRNRVDGRKPR